MKEMYWLGCHFSISTIEQLDKCSQWIFGTAATCLSGGKYFLLAVRTGRTNCKSCDKKQMTPQHSFMIGGLNNFTILDFRQPHIPKWVFFILHFDVGCRTGAAIPAPKYCFPADCDTPTVHVLLFFFPKQRMLRTACCTCMTQILPCAAEQRPAEPALQWAYTSEGQEEIKKGVFRF